MAAQSFHQGFQQSAGAAHPVRQRRTFQFHTFAGIHLRLAIQRLMIAVLRHQHMRQQTRSGQAALDRAARRRLPARCARSQRSLASAAHAESP